MSAVTQTTLLGAGYDDVYRGLVLAGYTEADAYDIVNKARKEKILSQHKYSIWDTVDRGNTIYRTKVKTENGTFKKIQRNSREKLEEALISYYSEREKLNTQEHLTLNTLWPEWIERKAELKSAGSVAKYKSSWKTYYLNEPLSRKYLNVPLTELDGLDLDVYVHKMINKYKMNSHSYGDFSIIIRQMLEYAKRKRYIANNPFDMVYVNAREDLYSEHKKSRDEQILCSDDLIRLIDYIWTQYYKRRNKVQVFIPLVIVFMFYTGLRLSEAVALKFSDFSGDSLHVSRHYSKDSHLVIDKVKKGEVRDIPLIPEAVEVIEEVKSMRIEMGLPIDSFIFPANDSIESVYKGVGKALTRYCAEIELFKHSSHDARRTFASHLISQGCPHQTVMSITGHRDLRTFERSYLYDTEANEVKKRFIRSAMVKK